ncbi:hypothetical protein B0H19DRAFT_1277388 [Mycena capillaripes]|nr:hypothetical protein B0H19DRAFT_1277388 [Mycena capillaripes]
MSRPQSTLHIRQIPPPNRARRPGHPSSLSASSLPSSSSSLASSHPSSHPPPPRPSRSPLAPHSPSTQFLCAQQQASGARTGSAPGPTSRRYEHFAQPADGRFLGMDYGPPCLNGHDLRHHPTRAPSLRPPGAPPRWPLRLPFPRKAFDSPSSRPPLGSWASTAPTSSLGSRAMGCRSSPLRRGEDGLPSEAGPWQDAHTAGMKGGEKGSVQLVPPAALTFQAWLAFGGGVVRVVRAHACVSKRRGWWWERNDARLVGGGDTRAVRVLESVPAHAAHGPVGC